MSENVRVGLAVALIAMTGALVTRAAAAGGNDLAVFQHRSDVTGIDFGDWPEILYTGAGGDGEVFAVLAADPLAQGPALSIRSLVFRYTRIGFSWAAWALALGNDRFVLPTMALIGIISVGAVAYTAGYLQNRLGWRVWLLVANPALLIGFMGDTAEPLALALLIAAFAGRSFLGAFALGIVRPSYMTTLVGGWPLFLAAAGSALAIRILAFYLFGGNFLDGGAGNVTAPLVGYFQEPSFPGFVIAGAGLATIAVGAIRRNLAWGVSGMLVVMLGPIVLEHPINALRAAGVLPVLWAFGPGYKATRATSEPSSTRSGPATQPS